MKHLLLGLALAAPLLATSAFAADIDARDPQKIIQIAKQYGEARLSKDDNGDPQIRAETKDGIIYQIYFHDCKSNRNCGSIRLYAGWSDVPVKLERLNQWNQENRYAKAYIDDVGDPVIEYDINLDKGGVNAANLKDSFNLWKDLMDEFSTKVIHEASE